MSSTFWKSVLISPVVLGMTVLLANGVMAAPKGTELAAPATIGTANDLILNKASGARAVTVAAGEPASTTTTPATTEVADIIKPSDWQYTALQGVASKYGCNPNLNNQPVSQIDFARGLNTCLNRVETSLALQQQQPTSVTQPSVTKEDLEVLKRLTQEFRAQLTEIDGRIVSADKKIAQAQTNQFSTTTKLKGEAIFNVTGAFSGSNASNLVFGDRVRLLFESSFSGQDRLYTRLATGNQPGLSGNFKNGVTAEGTQVSEGIPFINGNTTGLDWLAYQFPVNTNSSVYISATGGLHVDYAPTYGNGFDDATGGNGALSFFAESSPIYKIGGGSGIGTKFALADTGLTSVNLGYFAGGSPNSPTAGNGLFNGNYAFLGQLNFKLTDKLDAGLTYVNSYNNNGNPLFGFGGGGVGLTGTGPANATGTSTNANSYGAQFAYKASDTLAFNGFALNTSANKGGIGKQDIWSYGAGVSFPNFDGKGSLIGLLVGAEPYIGGNGSVPFHLEGFYKYKLSDNLSITPGVIYLTAPNQTNGNGGLIGVVRTTFTF